ncbi:MAG: DUF2490 domain-containing protein [Robiginitalea sp.]|nr:DUF2490 domain-containing protein [Robiginitalea sp.]
MHTLKQTYWRTAGLLTLLFLLLAGGPRLTAQETGEDTWGAWYQYFGMNRVSDRLSIHTEAQFRYFETLSNFNQMLLRTGLNYHINEKAIATLGYAYIDTDPTFSDSEELLNDIKEHRIFQQFLLYNSVWEFRFEHRYRLEQRFLDFDGVSDTRHRARYRLQLTLPLTDTFFLNFYDEIFINLQDEPFDQNRLYAAVGIRITENSSLQLGYLKNHFRRIDFDRLQVAFFYNPDLRGLFKKN